MTDPKPWKHPFEKIAPGPFRFVGFWAGPSKGVLERNPEAYYRMAASAPRLVNHWSSCALCGAYIINVAVVEFGDRAHYGIGSDCIMKLHAEDPALAGEVAVAVKAHRKALRVARAASKRAENARERALKMRAARHAGQVARSREAGAWLADHPAVHDALKGAGKDSRRSIAASLVRFGRLTENQMHFVVRVAEAAKAVWGKVPALTDRVEISGRLAMLKLKETRFGDALKCIVECELPGSGGLVKLYGTCPAALVSCQVGDRVSFMAVVEPSTREVEFGFFSRPTKPRAL